MRAAQIHAREDTPQVGGACGARTRHEEAAILSVDAAALEPLAFEIDLCEEDGASAEDEERGAGALGSSKRLDLKVELREGHAARRASIVVDNVHSILKDLDYARLRACGLEAQGYALRERHAAAVTLRVHDRPLQRCRTGRGPTRAAVVCCSSVSKRPAALCWAHRDGLDAGVDADGTSVEAPRGLREGLESRKVEVCRDDDARIATRRGVAQCLGRGDACGGGGCWGWVLRGRRRRLSVAVCGMRTRCGRPAREPRQGRAKACAEVEEQVPNPMTLRELWLFAALEARRLRCSRFRT